MYGIPSEFLKAYVHGVTNEGHRYLGAHFIDWGNQIGVRFLVYAPRAREVHIASDRNDWSNWQHGLQRIEEGFFVGFFPEYREGDSYKYVIRTQTGEQLWKADPYAFYSEQVPNNASKVFNLSGYKWNDKDFQAQAAQKNIYEEPMSIYEVHLGSWRRWDGKDYYTFDQFIDQLVPHVKDLGYTHVEIMPVTEFPYDGSWGYQQTGYFSITSRFGDPKGFMRLVDAFHLAGIGVILDWVPCHFPKDAHGLAYFDGQSLYESEFWHEAYNKQWDTLNFDFNRRHVCNFFLSNASFLRDKFHIDGIRADAVAYMIHHKFGEDHQQAVYNQAAISFLQEVNTQMGSVPGFMMMAEESSAFYGVSKSIEEGGLGFHFKWNMGWMNDTLSYMIREQDERANLHQKLTFPMMYAYSERFILPLSHDEVVHMKRSIVDKMPGYYDEMFAQLRLLYLYQYTHPGKKLLFMGGEFAQFREWSENRSLDWDLLDYEAHMKTLQYVRELNNLYRSQASLYTQEATWKGFHWIDVDNEYQKFMAYQRNGSDGSGLIICLNFSSLEMIHHRLIETDKNYQVIFNSDETRFYGRDRGSSGVIQPQDGHLIIGVAPFSGLILREEQHGEG